MMQDPVFDPAVCATGVNGNRIAKAKSTLPLGSSVSLFWSWNRETEPQSVYRRHPLTIMGSSLNVSRLNEKKVLNVPLFLYNGTTELRVQTESPTVVRV